VVFLATSNMRDRMDEAFLDRFSLQRFIGRPALSATFEILRSRINALIQRGLVACDNAISSKGHTDMSQTSISGYSSGDDHVPCSTSINTNSFLLPRPYSAAAAMHPNAENVVELSRIARFGETLSARKLEGVIDVAVCMYTTGNTCKLSQVFAALEKVLRQECSGVDREVVQSEPVEPSHMEPTEEEGLEEFDAEEEYRQWQESLGI
jgi:SpoVK/Ycf46/Vps4 family AAA+-type ATPase